MILSHIFHFLHHVCFRLMDTFKVCSSFHLHSFTKCGDDELRKMTQKSKKKSYRLDRVNEMDFLRNFLSAKKKKKDPYSPQSNKTSISGDLSAPQTKKPSFGIITLLDWNDTNGYHLIFFISTCSSPSHLCHLTPVFLLLLLSSVPMLPCLSAFGLAALIN